ncbi:MAG: hypothetical protein EOM21_19440 [Gammaproteobacteria bacterium]|nr:hypothetical protein [Gammaproteobacteria bacterium]
MKAIITTWVEASGPKIKLLGHGETEAQARVAAYHATHHGHNPYDEELQGGTLVEVGSKLADLINAPGFVTEYDDEGRIKAGHATEAHFALLDALGSLALDADGRLSYAAA